MESANRWVEFDLWSKFGTILGKAALAKQLEFTRNMRGLGSCKNAQSISPQKRNLLV